jgi:aspartate/methionine/tyrosine aminotransferase
LTKVFGLGPLRIGWAIGPEGLIARAIRIHDNLGVVHPFLTESIGERIFADAGRLRLWKERIRKRAEANRAMLDRFYRGHPEFEGGIPPAGILSFPRWRGNTEFPDAETLCRRAAEEAKIVFVPGRFYQRPDCLRIAVGGPEEETRLALDAFDLFLARAR